MNRSGKQRRGIGPTRKVTVSVRGEGARAGRGEWGRWAGSRDTETAELGKSDTKGIPRYSKSYRGK